jgi:hypothetical protein
MLEESHVKRFSNGISLVCVKDNLSAIVAFLQRGENIGRIVLSMSMVGYMTGLRSGITSGERLEWVIWVACISSRVTLALCIYYGTERAEHTNGLYQGICDLHFDEMKAGYSTG